MTQLAKYMFTGHQVRTNNDPFAPLFVAKDICQALGFKDSNNAIKQHVDPEDKAIVSLIDSMGRKQNVTAVNESGLYALIFGSKLDSAKKFKRWVTSEVLPSIRKTGTYTVPRKTLTVEQQQAIRQAIAKRCKDSSSSYQTVYKALYNAFRIPRYTELLQSDFDKAMELISGANLNVSVCRNIAPTLPEGALVLNASQVELLRITVYHFTELMTKPMKIAYQILSACDSPYAGRMYEANVCIPLYALKRFLEDRGIDTTKPKTLAG